MAAPRANGSRALYLQDEWKLAPALTVNYGLRFDRFTAFTSGQPGRARG